MAKTYDALDERLIAFIKAQKLFFVATAPLSAEGSVNVSPKGYDSLAVIDERTVAYVDLGGSGILRLSELDLGEVDAFPGGIDGLQEVRRIRAGRLRG